jgi:hypothetical protein
LYEHRRKNLAFAKRIHRPKRLNIWQGRQANRVPAQIAGRSSKWDKDKRKQNQETCQNHLSMTDMFRLLFNDFIKMLQPPTPLELAADELALAQRELLKAYSAEEYAQNIAIYNEQRIKRLTDFINQQDKQCLSNPLNSGTAAHDQNQVNKISMSNSVATLKRL